ncbi:MAG: DUF1405 domain-containing protein [Candidatus Hodarchaeales archaeon]|jgi:uncharacterized membrane protein YpjA
MKWNWQNLKENVNEINFNQIRYFLLNLHPLVLGVWIAINLFVPGYGLILYSWQYQHYHPIFWIFIPDSDSYGILFGIFLIVTLGLKKNVQILNIITFIGLMKVFFGYIALFTLIPSFFHIISLIAHTIEFIEGLLILPFLKTDFKNYSIATGILSLEMFLDFFNPFPFPTLAHYTFDPEFNINTTAPFLLEFFIVFSVIIFGFLFYIRLKHWSEDNSNIDWIEDLANY